MVSDPSQYHLTFIEIGIGIEKVLFNDETELFPTPVSTKSLKARFWNMSRENLIFKALLNMVSTRSQRTQRMLHRLSCSMKHGKSICFEEVFTYVVLDGIYQN
jgi:hypothetical protein